ncbi:MAG: sel1 repeat family protein [Burkholderiaceae bacterium]|nr:sel1 repeat family protein [Burkholderiaceae bacterium]
MNLSEGNLMSSVYGWKNQCFAPDHPAIAHVQKIVKNLRIDEENQRVRWATGLSLGEVFLALWDEIPLKDVADEHARRCAYYRKQLNEHFSMPNGILELKREGIDLVEEFLRKAGYQKGEVLGFYDEESHQKRQKNKALFDDAVDWVRRLANQGDPRAQFFYGSLFHFYDIEIDWEHHAYWTVKAALQGHYGAIFDLGSLIFEGLLPGWKRHLGRRCWELLCEENIDIVRYALKLHQDMRFLIIRKLLKVWLYIRPENRLEKKAQAQDVDSTVLYQLYDKYRSSWSKFYDPEKALYYLKRWIGPSQSASVELADHYYYGDIVPRNFQNAVSLYARAAREPYGYAASERLAVLYYEGVAVPRDLEKSLDYFLLAIKNNSHTAEDQIEYLIRERVFPESARALVRQTKDALHRNDYQSRYIR